MAQIRDFLRNPGRVATLHTTSTRTRGYGSGRVYPRVRVDPHTSIPESPSTADGTAMRVWPTMCTSIQTCYFALNRVYFHWEPLPSNKSEFTVISERSQFSHTVQPKGGGRRPNGPPIAGSAPVFGGLNFFLYLGFLFIFCSGNLADF